MNATAYETMRAAQTLGIELTTDGEQLHVKAPVGVMTLELKRALRTHKAFIMVLLALPEPAKPGAELEQLRREIGVMARDRASQEKRAQA